MPAGCYPKQSRDTWVYIAETEQCRHLCRVCLLQVQKSGDTIRLLSRDGATSATVVYADVRACNAIIQVIDTVLSPAASAAAAPTSAQAAPMLPVATQAGAAQPAATIGGR